jgi:hypothetical protein
VAQEVSTETNSLLRLLRSFCFPEGEESIRLIRAIILEETGSLQMAPGARPIPFTSEQHSDCTRSGFLWKAHLNPGKLSSATIVDTHEDGHGWITVKAIGLIPAKRFAGCDVDLGEMQRFLASVTLCPATLLNHPTLDFQTLEALTLRVSDQRDRLGAFVDIVLSQNGEPIECRAQRPRLVGKHSILTPWRTHGSEFRVFEGLRVPTRLEAQWDLPEGPFAYYRSEITSFRCLR